MDERFYFTILFSIFAMLVFVQRVLEIKFKQNLSSPRNVALWTTKVMVASHLFFFFGSLLELLLTSKSINYFFVLAGIIIFSLGFLLRKRVIKTLGPIWSINIEISDDQYLITDGPYALCRHPNYLAILMEVVGFCFIANSFYTLAVTLIVYIPIMMIRIKIEERVLENKFGSKYKDYSKSTPLIVPRLKMH